MEQTMEKWKQKEPTHTNNNCQDVVGNANIKNKASYTDVILDGKNAEVGPHKFWTNYNFSVRHIPMHTPTFEQSMRKL